MAKIVLSNVVSGYNPATINANFQAIAQHLNDKVLYRDNPTGEPNQIVQQTIDMNNKRLINLPAPTSDTEPMRRGDIGNLANDVADAKAAALAAAGSATQAANSATAAAGSANSAAISATTATTQAGQAGVYRNEALSFRNQAEQYSIAAYNNSRLAVGTVTTGAAGSSASVTINGNPGTQVINFTIPKGDKGDQGIQGIQGPLGPSGDGTGDVVGEPTTVIGNLAVWGNTDGKYIVDDGIASNNLELLSRKGQPNGYAPLGADGKVPDAYLNLAPEVVAPTNITPSDGQSGVLEVTTFSATGFFSSYGATHQATHIQISTSPTFNTILHENYLGAVTSYDVPAGVLSQNNTYYWRIRYQNNRGTWSAFSNTTSFSTAITFYNYIPTPQPTPAIGSAFEGGYYAGVMVWHEQAQSSTSHTIATGSKTFAVPDQAVTPIVYGGQLLTIRSRANPNNFMTGTVTSAIGTSLIVNVTSVGGSGTFTDWSIMARYRLIVAPKASRPTTQVSTTSLQNAVPNYLAHGHLNTAYLRANYNAATAPQAWLSNISAGGFSDWYTPAIEELYLILSTMKPTANNTVEDIGGWTTTSPGKGELVSATTTRRSGLAMNGAPAFAGPTTTTSPGQTTVAAFQNGNSEYIEGAGGGNGYLWSSSSKIYSTVGQIATNFITRLNGQTGGGQNTTGYVLPIRRSII